MEIVAVAALLVIGGLAFAVVRMQANMASTLAKPQVDVSQVVREVLDRFVEQSKSTNETITGVYAPPQAPAAPVVDDYTPPRMTTFSDFDDFDPTDDFLKPVREGATLLDGMNDSPFGVPGLAYLPTKRFGQLTIEDILGAGDAER